MKLLSTKLPTKIEGTFDLPKVREMIIATSESNVLQFIEFQLVLLAERINVGGNLSDSQIQFIAQQLIGLYPNETIADFKICFERGAIGSYGKIFKLDGIEIRQWMEQYLAQKYDILVDQLNREKENHYAPIPRTITEEVKDQQIKERLAAWLAQVKAIEAKAVPDITEKDIRLEGQEKPKAIKHPVTTESEARKFDLHRQWIRENFDVYTGDKLPTWESEEVWLSKQKPV